ncbi:MAG TPA: phosphoglycerate kinase, partial [Flavobacterium sp.]|nr:phosphoglycerate kinase [Flavobacterium sp.]
GWMALDIGPKTQENFSNMIKISAVAFLAGPMGKFEDEKFSEGSKAVLSALKERGHTSIIAGGDTIDVARRYSHLSDYSHVSLAGGATLEFLAGKELPALPPLIEK